MAPQMLHRVIHGSPDPEPWQKALIHFQPALLHGYRRHRVRGADYPGIIPETATEIGTEIATEPPSDTTVLGVLVSGLTEGDMYRLDQYEGGEYVKETVKVRTLCASAPEEEEGAKAKEGDGKATWETKLQNVLNAAGSHVADEADEVVASTYVWIAGRERLEEREWDFETFKREKLAWWVGAKESEW